MSFLTKKNRTRIITKKELDNNLDLFNIITETSLDVKHTSNIKTKKKKSNSKCFEML